MRIPIAALAAAACSPLNANAFAPVASTGRTPPSFKASGNDECATDACEIPVGFDKTPSLFGVPDAATPILSAVVTNSDGDFVRIDDAVRSSDAGADAPHVVIYLRHMG